MENKIYAALSKFASLSKPIIKEANNPFFKSKYATFDAIQHAIKPWLKDSGLILTHKAAGDQLITKVICSEDGSFEESAFPINSQAKPQEVGSAISYAKRYNTTALLDLIVTDEIDEDDDGNKANAVEKKLPAVTADTKPWMNNEQLSEALKKIAEGAFDGKNGREVVALTRTKYAVNKEMAEKIEKAVSLRIGNN